MTIQKLNKPLNCNIANGLNLHNKRKIILIIHMHLFFKFKLTQYFTSIKMSLPYLVKLITSLFTADFIHIQCMVNTIG